MRPRISTSELLQLAATLALLTCTVSNASAAVTDSVCAPNCYVATTGNDDTGNGTIGSPWLTLVKCFNEVHAGGTCWFRGGTYEAPDTSSVNYTSSDWGWVLGDQARPEYRVVANRVGHGGTAGNPVTIRGYPGETAMFTQDSGDICANLMTAIDGQISYVTWLDITFKSGRSFWGEGSDNITYERCIFKGQPSAPFGDVPAMLMSGANTVFSCPNWIVRNNLFISDSSDNTSRNSCVTFGGQDRAFTEFYSWSGGLIEHNDFIIESNSGNPDFPILLGMKNYNQSTTVQYNYLTDRRSTTNSSQRAIWIGGQGNIGESSGQNIARYNIVNGAGSGIHNSLTSTHDNDFYNNTFYATTGGCWRTLGDTGSEQVLSNEFFNNICVTGANTSNLYLDFNYFTEAETASVNRQTLVDYNIYSKIGSGTRQWKDNTRYTSDAGGIAAWQTYLDGRPSPAPTFEHNSRLANPGLVNPSAGDFSLAVGAAARTGGRGGTYPTYLGADDPNSTADYVGCNFDPRCHGYTGAADTTPPSAPSNLAATAASTTQINLTWTAATDAVGVTAYRVERCLGASCTTFSEIGTATGTTYSSTGLIASTTYRYRARAQDAAGNLGPYSNIAQATTAAVPPPDTTPPTAPLNLGASAMSSTQINLAWTAATDNVGVTAYRVERCQGAACTTFVEIGTATVTTYNNTGLADSTTYRYRVRAQDAAGNLGPYSNIAQIATPAPPPPGAGLAAAWGLNEGSGTQTADASGNGNLGSLVGNTAWLPAAQHDAGLSFDGSADSVQAVSSSSLDIGGTAITVSFWAWVDDTTGSDMALLEKAWIAGTQGSPPYQYGVEFDTQGDAAGFYFGTTAGVPNGPYFFSITPGTWINVAFTYDGSFVRGYRDGALVLTTAASGSIAQRGTPLRIGVDASGGQGLKGRLDDVRIYSRALSLTEIQSDMNTGVGAPADTTPPASVLSLRRTDIRP